MWDLVGEDVLITGAGPIGIMAVAICKYAGARHVVITDVNDYRLDLARKMGADAAVNVAKEKLARTAMDNQRYAWKALTWAWRCSGSGAGAAPDARRHAQRRQRSPCWALQAAGHHDRLE